MTFEEAVRKASEPVLAAFRQGKQALGADSQRVHCDDPRRFCGSIALDEALRSSQPSAPRWDYGVGLRTGSRESALWIEVHPAQTGEVGVVLHKLAWLKRWLAEEAPSLSELTRPVEQPYHWVSTDGVHIQPGTPQARRLRLAGLDLPKTAIHLD